MPVDPQMPLAARESAAALVAALRGASPEGLALNDIDLGPALEQQLFFALRDGTGRGPLGSVGAWSMTGAAAARALGAAVVGLVPPARVPSGGILMLVRLPAQFALLAPVRTELIRLAGPPLVVARVARAASAAAPPGSPRLERLIGPGAGLAALGPALRGVPEGARLDPGLEAIIRRELPRIALGAAALRSAVRRVRPRLLIGYDEVGTWSRILPAVARAEGLPSLNLPHAEAADPFAIAGAAYDRMAVFGPAARAVLEAAGIPASRIVETGAPHFDALARQAATAAGSTAGAGWAAAEAEPGSGTKRIVHAAQYVQGRMTERGLEACHRAAVAAAEAVAPAEVVLLPHPVQPPGQIEAIVARVPVPAGVTSVTAPAGSLHGQLDGAWAMVTGWSNSVFEAAILGVPSILVNPGGVAPVDFAGDGLGIEVAGEQEAAGVARSLLDPGQLQAAVERARSALAAHLGPLDGRAAERTARLVLELAATGTPRSA